MPWTFNLTLCDVSRDGFGGKSGLAFLGRSEIEDSLILNLKAAMAAEANMTSDDVWVYLTDPWDGNGQS